MIFSDLIKPKSVTVIAPAEAPPSIHEMRMQEAARRMHSAQSGEELHSALSDWMDARDAQTQPKGDAPISLEPGM